MGIWRALGGNPLIINLQICLWEKRYFYNISVGLISGECKQTRVACLLGVS